MKSRLLLPQYLQSKLSSLTLGVSSVQKIEKDKMYMVVSNMYIIFCLVVLLKGNMNLVLCVRIRK